MTDCWFPFDSTATTIAWCVALLAVGAWYGRVRLVAHMDEDPAAYRARWDASPMAALIGVLAVLAIAPAAIVAELLSAGALCESVYGYSLLLAAPWSFGGSVVSLLPIVRLVQRDRRSA